MWLMGWLMSVGTDACMRVHEMLQGIRGAGPAESRAGRGGDVSYVQYTRNSQHTCFFDRRTLVVDALDRR